MDNWRSTSEVGVYFKKKKSAYLLKQKNSKISGVQELTPASKSVAILGCGSLELCFYVVFSVEFRRIIESCWPLVACAVVTEGIDTLLRGIFEIFR